MNLGIDLRFYSQSPYGLAVYIRESVSNLLPKLLKENKFQKITLFIDSQNTKTNLPEIFKYESEENASKIEIVYTDFKYYSFAEQLKFLYILYSKKLDLVYFFTPNYPILYFKKFIFQVMDTTLLEHRKWYNPQAIALKLCFLFGLNFSKYVLTLSKTTLINLQTIFNKNIANSDILYSGISSIYTNTSYSNQIKANLLNKTFDNGENILSKKTLSKFKITKPYFHFISVFRSYKNIINLVKVFEKINQNNENKFQLVLAGSADKKFPEIIEFIQSTESFKNGDIILTGAVSDQEAVHIIDHSNALIAPSLAEGFGLWLLESAVRGTNIIASDIPVFKEILAANSALFFDPQNLDSMQNEIQKFIDMAEIQKNELSLNAFFDTQHFNWNKTSDVMLNAINNLS